MDIKGKSTRSAGAHKRIRAAFTLVELFVVIATVAVLSFVLRPAHTASKGKTIKVRCQDNLRQLVVASAIYAAGNRGWFAGTIDDASDDVSHLYPNYLSPAKALGRGSVFVCPGTENFIRTNLAISPSTRRLVPQDLLVQATFRKSRSILSRTNDLAGVSYEIFAFMHMTVRKTETSTAQWVHQNNAFGLRGKVFGPSDIFLFVDGDRESLTISAINNYPDPNDNHGAQGANMVMCDGSVKWVKGGAPYLLAWETSQDENRSAP